MRLLINNQDSVLMPFRKSKRMLSSLYSHTWPLLAECWVPGGERQHLHMQDLHNLADLAHQKSLNHSHVLPRWCNGGASVL